VLTQAPSPETAPSAPLSLTSSDGTALALRTIQARAVVEAPLSWTELTVTFDNPEARTLEGRFQVELPPGADIARFAMKVGGQWQEGEVVERLRAQQIYEDYLHRRVDPALLEHETGNRFSARVFPIQPKGEVELIIAWSQATTDTTFRIPLRGLPELEEVDVSAILTRSSDDELSRAETVQLHYNDWTPTQDFELPLPSDDRAVRSGQFVVARVTPTLEAPHEGIDSLFILVDSSASRALHYNADIARVRQLIAALAKGAGPDTPVAVATYDQSASLVFEGRAGDFGTAQVDQMTDRLALGATDTAGALQWLAHHLGAQDTRYHRVVMVTDGLSTAGDNDAAELQSELAMLRQAEVTRLDVLTSGGLRDEDAQQILTTVGLPSDGAVLSLSKGLGHVAERLELATTSGLKVDVPGASWVWPETLEGVQPGDSVLVTAQVAPGEPLNISIEGVPAKVELHDGSAPLVERASAAARIDRLVSQRDTLYADDPDMRRALQDTATQLSVEQRVLTPWTALLVLETASDYQRYGIAQNNLAAVHSVGPTGLVVYARDSRSPASTGRLSRRGDLDVIAAVPEDPQEEDSEATWESAPEGEPGARGTGDGAGARGEAAEPRRAEKSEATNKSDRRGSRKAKASPTRHARSASRSSSDSAPSASSRRVTMPIKKPKPVKKAKKAAWTGSYAEVQGLLSRGQAAKALAVSQSWWTEQPGDVLAAVALGESFVAMGQPEQAERAWGSLIDLYPSRPDLRRVAGNHLETLDSESALTLAIDTYTEARDQRPDHPTGHRMLAYALARADRPAEAFDAMVTGCRSQFRWQHEVSVRSSLSEDVALLGAVLAHTKPDRAAFVDSTLATLGLSRANGPSTRFVLTWETDANDVDLHVSDGRGDESWFAKRTLASGGSLHRGVFDGFGPETFSLHREAKAYPYRFQAHYYRRGPMGWGIGKLQIVQHDGKGGLAFHDRPYVVMVDDAWVDLGVLERPLPASSPKQVAQEQ